MVVERHLRQGGANQEGCHDRPGQDFHQSERKYGQPRTRLENLGYADGLDLRPDGTGLHPNKNRHRRLDERAGSGGVQDLEVLLQDGFRHEGNQEGGSGVCTVTKVLHVQVEGGTGTHSLPEFRECGNGGKRNDKGRSEQTRG